MLCFIDYRTSLKERLILSKMNLELIDIPKSNLLYDAIDGHPDIQLHVVDKDNKVLLCHPDIDNHFLKEIRGKDVNIIYSEKKLSLNYPNNIILNAFSTKEHFIHNTKYTDKTLMNYNKYKTVINVSQGYSKCSILPVTDNAIITNDPGIHKVLLPYKFDVLLLPYGDISLPPFEHGFIGGVGGTISLNKMVFFGSLDHYAFGTEVKKFLYKYDVEPIYLDNTQLKDRGSLLTL